MNASETPGFVRIDRRGARALYNNGGTVRMVSSSFPATSTRAYDFSLLITGGEAFAVVVRAYEDVNCTGSQYASFYIPQEESK